MRSSPPHSVLNVAVDQRFQRSSDGQVWTYTPPSFEFFEAALQIFAKVRVIARTADVEELPERARRVTGPNLEVIPIPYYVGPLQYISRYREVQESLRRASELDGAYLLRIPSQVAFGLARELHLRRRKFATELLADPQTFFAPGVAPNSLATWFRPYFRANTRKLCEQAVVANYVTGKRTMRENPATRAYWSASVSDIELNADYFLPIELRPFDGLLEIVTVGFLDFLVKGQDLLLEALARCQRSGLRFRLTIVGDGAKRDYLTAMAERLGIGGSLRITGALGGALQVREYVRQAHLSVLPSRSEGIPRAVIESMAAGTPVIGSSVGAMPDLLDPEWIVPVNDAVALGRRILAFAAHPEDWTRIARRNQIVARQYEASQLVPRRLEFYRAIRDCSGVDHDPAARMEDALIAV